MNQSQNFTFSQHLPEHLSELGITNVFLIMLEREGKGAQVTYVVVRVVPHYYAGTAGGAFVTVPVPAPACWPIEGGKNNGAYA